MIGLPGLFIFLIASKKKKEQLLHFDKDQFSWLSIKLARCKGGCEHFPVAAATAATKDSKTPSQTWLGLFKVTVGS